MRQSIKDKGLQMSLFTRDHLVFALQKHELGTKLQIIINLLFMVPNFASSVSTHTHDSNNKLENQTMVWVLILNSYVQFIVISYVWFQTSYILEYRLYGVIQDVIFTHQQHFSCSFLSLICLSTNQNIQLIHSLLIKIEWTTGNGILMSSSHWPIYYKLYPDLYQYLAGQKTSLIR